MARSPDGQGWREAGGIQAFLQGLKIQTTQPADNVVNLDRKALEMIAANIGALQRAEVHAQAEQARIAGELEKIGEALRLERERFCEIGRDLGVKCEVPQ